MEGHINILGVCNRERLDIIESAKAEAEPYLAAGDAVRGWLSFVKVMRDNKATARDFSLSLGTNMILRGGTTPDQIRSLINGFK